MTTLPATNKAKWRKLPLGSLPLRNRLVIGSLSIVFMAIAIMGAYVFYQSRMTNSILTNQLDKSVLQQAETTLDTTADRHATALTNFFSSLNTGILSLRLTSQSLFTNQNSLETGMYWDAGKMLSRNDKGSWDNSNDEAGSVFIPAASEVTTATASELNAMKQMDFVAPSLLEMNSDTIAVYFGGLSGYTLYYPNIDLAAIVPADFDVTGRPWFVDAAPGQNPSKDVVWSEPYVDAALNGIVITNSAPVYDDAGRFRGVVAQDIQLKRITDIITTIQVGDSGYAFLVDQANRLIAMPDSAYQDLGINPEETPLGSVLSESDLIKAGAELPGILSKMKSGGAGRVRIAINGTERFVVYRPIQGVKFSLAVVVPVQEMLIESLTARQQIEQDANRTLAISVFIVLGIMILTSIITLNFSNNLTSPLASLTRTAQDLANGNLNARADLSGQQNEFSTLAATLNLMAAELKESINSLETRVEARTAEAQQRSLELETANKKIQARAAQFEALAQVTQNITSVRDLQTLLPIVTKVISEKFGFYHVGIFLLDEVGLYAILSAANSEGGRRMLERKHRLRVGEEGIVGYATNTGQPRIAMDVGTDAVFFNNPDLPDTHSEMALPLISKNIIVGALDVQSTVTAAFTDEDVQMLSLLADQVSLAIENARLFEETRRALGEAEAISRQITREGFGRLSVEQNLVGYQYSVAGAKPLEAPLEFPGSDTGKGKQQQMETSQVQVPIELRGETIGTLAVQTPSVNPLNQDQIDLIKAVAERVALAAENARLFDETSRRAERERMVSDITSKIRSVNDPDLMIKTAMEELRNALGASRVEVVPQIVKGRD